MANNSPSSEKEIFRKNYATFCDVLKHEDDLLPYLVEKNIISLDNQDEIKSKNTADKGPTLLKHISGPLKANHTQGFYGLLEVMINHGKVDTQEFAKKIKHECLSNSTAVGQVSSDISHHHTPNSAASSTVTTPDPLSVHFSRFVTTIEALLEKCHDKLEQSKQFCSNLAFSNNPDELLFNDEQLQRINACTTFNELFTILRKHWSLLDYSILKEIIAITDLKEARDELELFKTIMGSYEGMKIISENIRPEAISNEYIMLSVIIDQPYQELTLDNFIKLRDFIFKYLDIQHHTALPHIKYLIKCLHLVWYVLKKAVPHMVKMAQRNKEIFTSNSVVFIQIDKYVMFDYRAKDKTQIDDPRLTSSASQTAGSIQNGIEHIKGIVGGQFTEQEIVEALLHTKNNPENALDYLLRKGTESVDNPELSSKISDKKKRKIPKEILRYTKDDLQKAVKDVLPKFKNNILDEVRDRKIIEGVLLLLMVVNPNEFLATMNYFSKSKVGPDSGLLNSGGNNYYVGKWGKIPAAVVRQVDQGTGGPSGSQQLTCSSVNLFKNLKVIIGLGVCGTMGQLGDVIVSSRIDGCNCQKIKGNQIINRSLVCRPGKEIRGFLMLNSDIWSYTCTRQGSEVYEAKVVFKPMLSGTPLIASGEYRDKLLDNVSQEAGGVEMEGIGVVDGIDICKKKDKIEFIIVKAGCDYADEEKSKEWQPVAAMAAADFVYKQLDTKVVHKWFSKDQPAEPLIDL